LLALFIVAGAVVADEVQVIGNKTVTGTIISINDSQIEIRDGSGKTAALPIAQVLGINIRPTKPLDPQIDYTKVKLTDDTILNCKKIVFHPKEVELTLLSDIVQKVPVTTLAWYLREANNKEYMRWFENQLANRTKTDRLVILVNKQLN